MSVDITYTGDISLVTLTRQLNSLSLAQQDAKKLQNSQIAGQVSRRLQSDAEAEQLTAKLRQQQQQNQQAFARQQQQQGDQDNTQQTTLKSLVPPKAQLSPAEEVATFADTSGTQSKSQVSAVAASAQAFTQAVHSSGSAVDESGESVPVEVITPQPSAPAAQVLNINIQAAAATAALYASTNEAVHANAPISIAA